MIRCSVIVPTCHRPHFLAVCLERLAPGRQTLAARDYEVVRAMFHKFPYQGYLDGDTARKMLGLNKGADHILGLEDGKSRYLRSCASLAKAFSLASTSDYARGIGDEVACLW